MKRNVAAAREIFKTIAYPEPVPKPLPGSLFYQYGFVVMRPLTPDGIEPFTRAVLEIAAAETHPDIQKRMIERLGDRLAEYQEGCCWDYLEPLHLRFLAALERREFRKCMPAILKTGLELVMFEYNRSSATLFDYAVDYYRDAYRSGKHDAAFFKGPLELMKAVVRVHGELVTRRYMDLCSDLAKMEDLPIYRYGHASPHQKLYRQKAGKENLEREDLRGVARAGFGEAVRIAEKRDEVRNMAWQTPRFPLLKDLRS